MSVPDQKLQHLLSRIPFPDTAELAMIPGKAHVVLHRGLTNLQSSGIVDRVSYGNVSIYTETSPETPLTATGTSSLSSLPTANVATAPG